MYSEKENQHILFMINRRNCKMKKTKTIITLLLSLLIALSIAGCGKKSDQSLVGVWEYSDTENGIGAVYDLREDGTGTYTMTVGDQEVVYELKYEVKDSHLLVRFVNNETFTEDDVFDNEFKLKDANTLIIKDSMDTEMTFVKK